MGRVSLTEDYDDRSVISKLNEMDKRVKENTTVVTSAEASAKASAAAAQETADRFAGSVGAVVQNANAQINASKAQVDQAKAEVDETVTTVAQAVQTANQASASAQQSANTVATYDARLTAVEDADAQNVKLNGAQTINGEKTFSNIIIPTSTGNYNGGMVFKVPDSLSTTDIITAKNNTNASVLNFRLLKDSTSTLLMTALRTPSNQQKYTVYQVNDDGTQVFRGPAPYKGAPSDSYVTKGYVESTDGETNNLVHRTSAETINGVKTFNDYAVGKFHGIQIFVTPNNNDSTHWFRVAEWESTNSVIVLEIYGSLNNVSLSYAKVMAGHLANTDILCAIENKGTNEGIKLQAKMTIDGAKCTLWVKSRAYHSAIINQIGCFGSGVWHTLNITGTNDTTLYDEPTAPPGGNLVNMSEMI